MDDQVVELLESGCILIVGTTSPDGVPDATRAFGVSVAPDHTELRVALGADAGVAVANLAANRSVALTATHLVTLESVQVKGRARCVEPPTPADRIRHDAYVAELLPGIAEADGVPIELPRRLVPPDIVMFVMTADEHFDQTPGPTAGAPLDADRP